MDATPQDRSLLGQFGVLLDGQAKLMVMVIAMMLQGYY